MSRVTKPASTSGDLDVGWHAGWPSPKHDPAPEIQVHAYDERTVILRQNMSVHFEAPFLFLLLGADRALLLDTGATEAAEHFPLRRVVDSLLADRIRHRPDYALVVAHTHGHGDHVAGDPQFVDRPNTTIVGRELADVVGFFGLRDWPAVTGEFDLGDRLIDVIPGPGHQAAAVVFHDRDTGLLFTGDTFYPGRLYVEDWPAFAATVDRLTEFCARRSVSGILGCHIEMTTTPGVDYPRGTTHQPAEPPLAMTVDQLGDLRRAVAEIDGRPGVHRFDDFIIHNRGGE
ncbi:MBL fold metallo-hydrolase [Actinoalloteichus fjordicus]|uniref:Zn-dependent hydrolase, glyoxylase n=1 Tax=Actinoalloteichus fjordicus TaxID=1612552 RepID=A0AAC9PTY8_9PSEU|nr:MBL fold metallo-hydrolase [Actinoalloteichus fjordicus]APU16505.1 Zn-dependent hydrolase, glyoxylase [Actinoalloteichus fjordicus]